MERTSIELITGFTKTGKPQYQKYLAKPLLLCLKQFKVQN